MENQEMLKQNLVDKRLTLASLMFNASSVMEDEELEEMRELVRQMHQQPLSLEEVSDQTDDLIQQLQDLLE